MANEIKNETSFDHFLDSLAAGLSVDERAKANKAGAQKFIDIMKPKVPKRTNIKETNHLRDSLIELVNPNGSVEVGFAKKDGKGFVARILNDGWTPKPPYSRGKKSSYAKVAGKHFWEATESEARGVVAKAVYGSLKETISKKAIK